MENAPVARAELGADPELEMLLYGRSPLPRIVAVEPAGMDGVMLLRRREDGTVYSERDTFKPWLLTSEVGITYLPSGECEVTPLDQTGMLNHLAQFSRWPSCAAALAALREAQVPHFAYPTMVAQYLVASGRTLFYDMRFQDLHRVQIDVETSSLQANAPNAGILMVALTDSRGYEAVFSARDGGEAVLLQRLGEQIASLDPDVIEGHNVLDFDLPYLAARAQQLRISLDWGRGRQRMWLQEREGRFKVGARLLPSTRIHVYGRHIVDTYQQIQRFDSEGKLESYALKSVMEALELVRPDRQFVDRTAIGDLWDTDPERLARYCLDDARDVRTLADLVTPTDFYQSQIVPRSYQDVASGGTGEKINGLMIRAYVARASGVPLPQEPRPYPGGYLELRESGVFRRVVKCDVESLYPAVMLHYGVKPKSDRLNVFLPLLGELTRQRLHAKHQIRASRGAERAYWTGLSASYKVLVNSFYGYLGYGRANFNDFDAAEFVTTTGQRLIKEVIAALEARNCQIIEVDTDGVYFVPPPEVEGEEAELRLVEEVGHALPSGINLAHDGRFAGMVALKQKTYFLLTHDGRLIAKGSSLRSRRDEIYLRTFVQHAAVTLIRGSLQEVSEQYQTLAHKVQAGELPVEQFSRRESITAKTYTSPGLRRLAAAAKGTPIGHTVQVYQRLDGSLALTSEYVGDEDRDYLLRRLHDMARRFEVICTNKDEFQRLFPRPTAKTPVSAERPVQLPLF
jgi:DNA polymerase, archaea type